MRILGANLIVAERKLDIANQMVAEGEGSNREVTDAQAELTNTEIGILSAKTDFYLAYLDLRHAMGDDLVGIVSQ